MFKGNLSQSKNLNKNKSHAIYWYLFMIFYDIDMNIIFMGLNPSLHLANMSKWKTSVHKLSRLSSANNFTHSPKIIIKVLVAKLNKILHTQLWLAAHSQAVLQVRGGGRAWGQWRGGACYQRRCRVCGHVRDSTRSRANQDWAGGAGRSRRTRNWLNHWSGNASTWLTNCKRCSVTIHIHTHHGCLTFTGASGIVHFLCSCATKRHLNSLFLYVTNKAS